ncbi:CDP-diacylglycerol--glycerol-3-phosphate 3-phosphatidyltransferase [Candidatus Bipolaricaulota bacterium]|nr:CDP-diacylglycerol--glycerol-3-phosphate 3-phosphatidyltransferase [Candidatus Bipolaricaulota bacterium]
MRIFRTIPNQITLSRILFVPLLMFLILFDSDITRILAMVLFFLAALSDVADGYIARSLNQTSLFGKFADPIADKLLIAGALIALLQLGEMNAWVVLVIIAREFLVTGLRILAISEGQAIGARFLGKAKTISHVALVLAILIDRSFAPGPAWAVIESVCLGLALALSVLSGAEYFYRSRRLFA